MRTPLSLALLALLITWSASAQEKQPSTPNAKPIPLDEKLSAIKAKHAVLHDRDSTAKVQRLREVGPAIDADPEVVQASKRLHEALTAFRMGEHHDPGEMIAAQKAFIDKQAEVISRKHPELRDYVRAKVEQQRELVQLLKEHAKEPEARARIKAELSK